MPAARRGVVLMLLGASAVAAGEPPKPAELPPIADATDVLTGKKPLTMDLMGRMAKPDPAAPPIQVAGAVTVPEPPAPRYVNAPKVVFDYEVGAKGSSGVKEAQLWATADGGKAWKRVAAAKAGEPLTANLGKDGRYGASLVLVSGVGVSSGEPQPGATPELVVVVDTVPPAVTLSAPLRTDAGWQFAADVTDANLDPDLVRLQWRDAEKPAGEWRDVPPEAAHPAGPMFRWSWSPGAGTPAQVDVRVVAADKAGNVATAVAGKAIPGDAVPPKGKLTGVRPVPANAVPCSEESVSGNAPPGGGAP